LAKKTESPEITPGTMPIMSHLRELRDRIFKSGIAIVIGTAIGFIFCPQILKILIAPAGDMDLQAIELVENLAVYFKVSLAAGIIITMPFLVYQGIAYIAPALTAREKGIVYRILPAVTVMFLGGIAFAYYVALPPALNFLKNFMSNIADTYNNNASGKDGHCFTAVAGTSAEDVDSSIVHNSGDYHPHL
jgi:sec-independent protein translocase protein TatC